MADRHTASALGLLAALLSAAPALAADGAALFAGTCAACHGEGGVGIDGLAPPLVDAELWTGLGDKAPTYLAGVMAGGLSGKITAKGIDFVGLVMPPQTEIPDAELAAIGTYVLKELNGLSVAPDEAAIAAAKAAPPTHKALRALRRGE
ncbi:MULTISPECIES: c-type cytochrome [unclassified Aureimonas]|uniref:c-type cytochrome n=1 Tax=unclassified Aureimonas TaxID=2615206 RepID=UPI0006FE2095|nr:MULTISPECIES: cytochrome c [unclassified Aureimonas]KQT64052.1 hypothetical protein ASG62_03280 [Aureimonas sp. Leaf427]KQT81244.1 hypothetical protein ASG54_00550 [Aureimonas sp. Leaf460]